ncbi:hypothetical protein PTTG_27126 [Puccinia triticina 1-1 BBBD Race 1]|uniref:OTU domain-containing protein n=1 Tax=Puccinia triticina (isolate 1-1 / race 1 (BBBD)) TaxID=630390 RepID=A0A180GNN9_PUCT1|nr:hypothetical protein PTTG_27126 [Puccinia triticina 1-1 BBBD Race 1]
MTVRKTKKHAVEIYPAIGFRYPVYIRKIVYLACLMMVMFLIARMRGRDQGPDYIQSGMAPTDETRHVEDLQSEVDDLAQASQSYFPSSEHAYRTLSGIRITTPQPPLASARVTPIKSFPGYSKTEGYIKMDGNCLFRTFAHFKYGDQERHIQVRKEMIKYIETKPMEFQDFVEGEESEPELRLKNYLLKMENGAWGDEISIKALSEAYGLNIVVLSISNFSIHAQLHVVNERTQDFKGAYLQNEHYELLLQNLHIAAEAPKVRPSI